ncbi:MAG TPA: radical SAM protein, partial [Polyangiaceae bacterium]
MSEPLALQALLPEELLRHVPCMTLAEARAVVSAVHRDKNPFAPSSRVRRVAREALASASCVPTLGLENEARSSLDPFLKLVFRTHDERLIESVRIPLERAGRFSVCVSSQVGCALGCAFCATGRLGLARNLETWEIVEQVRAVRRTLDPSRGERVHGVVFQGMGEPLANAERVIAAVRVLTEPSGGAIDARNVTVCTAGLPSGIALLARALPRVRLGWSIGSAAHGRRRALMPIDGAHPLEEVFRAGVEHAKATGLAPLWAVTLLSGVNDGEEDARSLGELAARFTRETGRRPRISVIPYNRIAEDAADPFRRTSDAAESRFRDVVHASGVFTHKRYSGGSDIGAA